MVREGCSPHSSALEATSILRVSVRLFLHCILRELLKEAKPESSRLLDGEELVLKSRALAGAGLPKVGAGVQ